MYVKVWSSSDCQLNWLEGVSVRLKSFKFTVWTGLYSWKGIYMQFTYKHLIPYSHPCTGRRPKPQPCHLFVPMSGASSNVLTTVRHSLTARSVCVQTETLRYSDIWNFKRIHARHHSAVSNVLSWKNITANVTKWKHRKWTDTHLVNFSDYPIRGRGWIRWLYLKTCT